MLHIKPNSPETLDKKVVEPFELLFLFLRHATQRLYAGQSQRDAG